MAPALHRNLEQSDPSAQILGISQDPLCLNQLELESFCMLQPSQSIGGNVGFEGQAFH